MPLDLRPARATARAIFGGFVELAARQIALPTHWDVRLVVAFTESGSKSVSSTEAMERSRKTSPFHDAWVEAAPGLAETVKQAIRDRDLEALGVAMEQSTLYWGPATISALHTVAGLRTKGVQVWSTMDAGPHVKALCRAQDAHRVRNALKQTPSVLRVLVATPGSGVAVFP